MQLIRKNSSSFFKSLWMIFDRLIGKYGFINRVIDGISLTITNLTFAIKAQNFKASVFVRKYPI
jgi:riboflavin synthase alpha subunit